MTACFLYDLPNGSGIEKCIPQLAIFQSISGGSHKGSGCLPLVSFLFVIPHPLVKSGQSRIGDPKLFGISDFLELRESRPQLDPRKIMGTLLGRYLGQEAFCLSKIFLVLSCCCHIQASLGDALSLIKISLAQEDASLQIHHPKRPPITAKAIIGMGARLLERGKMLPGLIDLPHFECVLHEIHFRHGLHL